MNSTRLKDSKQSSLIGSPKSRPMTASTAQHTSRPASRGRIPVIVSQKEYKPIMSEKIILKRDDQSVTDNMSLSYNQNKTGNANPDSFGLVDNLVDTSHLTRFKQLEPVLANPHKRPQSVGGRRPPNTVRYDPVDKQVNKYVVKRKSSRDDIKLLELSKEKDDAMEVKEKENNLKKMTDQAYQKSVVSARDIPIATSLKKSGGRDMTKMSQSRDTNRFTTEINDMKANLMREMYQMDIHGESPKRKIDVEYASRDNPLNSANQSHDNNANITKLSQNNSQTFEKNLMLQHEDKVEIQTAQKVIEKFKESLDEDAHKINQWADD